MYRFLLALSIAVAVNSDVYADRVGEPITIVDGYPVVATFINGQGPYRMLIDTGAARCSLRPKVATQIGIVATRQLLLTTLTGEQSAPVASAVIRVGSFETLASEILIHDLPGADKVGARIDGLLGQSFLAQHPYLLDYRAKKLWFGEEALARAEHFSTPVSVELSYGRPVVPVVIDGQLEPLRVVLDSGVSQLVISCGDQCPRLEDVHTITAITNTGQVSVRQGRIRSAFIGSSKWVNAPTVLIRRSSDASDEDGLLPTNWFSAIFVNTEQKLIRFEAARLQ
jgi:hypothetical protein